MAPGNTAGIATMTDTSAPAQSTEGTPRVAPTPSPAVERAVEVAAQKAAVRRDAEAALERAQAAQSAAASSGGVRLRSAYAEYTVNHETHHVSVRIVDAHTKETIREIPPEETQRMIEALRQYAATLARRRAATATLGL